MEIVAQRIRAGVWEGVLTGAAVPPALTVSQAGEALPPPGIEPLPGQPGSFRLRVPIPPERIGEGVTTFVIGEAGSGARLASFALLAGEVLAEDLQAEVSLLHAELELLKAAFRRHVAAAGD